MILQESDQFVSPERSMRLFSTMYKTNHLIVKEVEEQLQFFNLTLGKLYLLISLKRLGKTAQPSELSDALSLTRANISGLLNTLESNCLVSRRVDSSNRRRILVQMTDVSEKLLENVLPVYVQTLSKRIQARLSDKEQDQLI
ncbi:MarR family winged helix-turn-helix transcriptional regulator [Paenibacillus brasilensis]|uniref:MarR family winged helix-turn-helix transcriptional regulator n=1 Tax=Paenibacillus brasilensis TaxID=128574 RepID=UPI001266C3E8|nr:MarR family transcriptional regulator [Paenibacillus brasilensis]